MKRANYLYNHKCKSIKMEFRHFVTLCFLLCPFWSRTVHKPKYLGKMILFALLCSFLAMQNLTVATKYLLVVLLEGIPLLSIMKTLNSAAQQTLMPPSFLPTYPVLSPGCDLVGFPQEKLKWCIKSQANAPTWAHKDATSQIDF